MRIRSIKPEFWRSDDITSLSIEDRLLFIGLWSYVDDNGVGRGDEALIVADLFATDHYRDPRETVARVSGGLARLSSRGLVTLYRVDGKPYIYVSKWEQHQRVDKPNKPRYPGPDRRDSAERETLATPSRESRDIPAPGTGEQGNRGTGEQGRKDLSDLRSNEPAPTTALALVPHHKDVARPKPKYPADFEQFWQTYPLKQGKGAALKAFAAAKRVASVEEIIAGAVRYATDPNRDPQFTKHPTTWLNARSWDDEPLPRRRPVTQHEKLAASVDETIETLARMGIA